MSTDPSRTSTSSRWRYWKTPVLFGAGFFVLQVLVALVRFGFIDSWDPAELLLVIPAILSGLVLFFLGGLLVGLLAQRVDGRDRPYCSALSAACSAPIWWSSAPLFRICSWSESRC